MQTVGEDIPRAERHNICIQYDPIDSIFIGEGYLTVSQNPEHITNALVRNISPFDQLMDGPLIQKLQYLSLDEMRIITNLK